MGQAAASTEPPVSARLATWIESATSRLFRYYFPKRICRCARVDALATFPPAFQLLFVRGIGRHLVGHVMSAKLGVPRRTSPPSRPYGPQVAVSSTGSSLTVIAVGGVKVIDARAVAGFVSAPVTMTKSSDSVFGGMDMYG